MRRFEKWRDTDADPTEAEDAQSVVGTPVSANGEGFREFITEVDGFSPGADTYVYAVVLVRVFDETTWYYVGETASGEEGLENRIEKHIRGKMKKPVRRSGTDVLDGTFPEDTTDTYTVIGVEQAEPVSMETETLQRARTLERERKMAYEIALEKQTTNVLGGS
jgi:hypothetical protein